MLAQAQPPACPHVRLPDPSPKQTPLCPAGQDTPDTAGDPVADLTEITC